MKKYKVFAVYEVEVFTSVEAENLDGAYEKALEIDGGDYAKCGMGNWRIYDVYEDEGDSDEA